MNLTVLNDLFVIKNDYDNITLKYKKTKINEEIIPNRDNNKNKIFLLFFTIKRDRLITGEKSSL